MGDDERRAVGDAQEPVRLARQAALGAMARVIQQSMVEADARVRLAANEAVLRYAGVEPPRRVEVVTPEGVLEQMTVGELEALAVRGVWPGRFREVLRAYGAGPVVVDVTPGPKGEP